MAIWAGCAEKTPRTVLDVGCGIGGASRHLAKGFGEGTSVTGITLSPKQVARATELAEQQGVLNADFRVMNALAMDFPDNSSTWYGRASRVSTCRTRRSTSRRWCAC